MGIVIRFPNYESDRFEPLREFVTESESERRTDLTEADKEDLEFAIEYAWPGVVALEPGWKTKWLFVFAGFAMGIGIHP